MNGRMIILASPSGAGKTTVARHLLSVPELKLSFSVSACSREKRPNEAHGKDYYFLSTEEFNQRIKNNDFIEWEEVYEGMFYGTLKSEVERIWKEGKNVIFDVDVKGAMNIKKLYGDAALSLFIMPPSTEELERRLRTRNTDPEKSITKRIERARYEMFFANTFDKILVNDNIETALRDAEKIVSDFLFPSQQL